MSLPNTNIAQAFSMVNGVAQVVVFGSQKYAVRVYLDPEALSKRGLGLDKVVSAIQNANSNLPSGVLQGTTRNFTVKSSGKLQRAQNFNELVVAYQDGMPVRLSDVGRAEDSIENVKIKSWLNDDRAIILAIYRQPGANTVEVVRSLRALFPRIESEAPPGVRFNVVNDRSEFIQSSIHEVEFHLILSMVLVVLAILAFLRNARSTIITALILPTSVIGTFAAMYLLGFSLNNLSLMAIILAVGFVVDDAIVVLENITRHMEMGKDRMRAALEGSKEIAFTVLSMTISLAAVFHSDTFHGGIARAPVPGICCHGRRGRADFRCRIVVDDADDVQPHAEAGAQPWPRLPAIRADVRCDAGFLRHDIALDHAASRSDAHWFGRGAGAHGFYLQDRSAGVHSAPGHGRDFRQYAGTGRNHVHRTRTTSAHGVGHRPEDIPTVEAVMSTAGQGTGGVVGDNVGRIIVRLKSRDERKLGADQVIQELRRSFAGGAQGLRVFMNNPPSINIGGLVGNADYQMVVQGTDLKTLYASAQELEARLRESSLIQDVSTSLELRNPEIQISILRDRAAALGVSPQQIEATLYNAYGGRQISTLYGATDQYYVLLEFEPRFQRDINALRSLFVQSSSGRMVPINAVADINIGVGPVSVSHYGQLPSVVLSFNLAPGVSIGDAVAQAQDIAREMLPSGISATMAGSAKAFQDAFRTLPVLLLITILVIYMVLAILYEHYAHPVTILTALPFAGFGALLMLLLFNQQLNIFSFVGIILLVGLVKKNGIMMVDFALQLQREKGLPAAEAIIEACDYPVPADHDDHGGGDLRYSAPRVRHGNRI